MLKSLALILAVCALAHSQEECGKKPPQKPYGTHIVNGREADAHAWPWQLSLQFYNEAAKKWGHTCGAVLIGKDHAITAAHCTDPNMDPARGKAENFRLLAGAHDKSVESDTHQILMISKIINHERFIMEPILGFPNDITVLKLASSAEFTPEVYPACIPKNNDTEFGGNKNCYISGWGLTDFWNGVLPNKLQEAKVPVWTYEQCLDRHFGNILKTHICVGEGELDYPNPCQGDSGGPLNCLGEDGLWYVAGVTSWGILGCEMAPGVYTHVAKYHKWIEARVAENP